MPHLIMNHCLPDEWKVERNVLHDYLPRLEAEVDAYKLLPKLVQVRALMEGR